MTNAKYSITEEITGGDLQIRIINSESGESVAILPESGARIKELTLSNNGKMISVLKGIRNTHSSVRDEMYTNAKLSPFAGRIEGGRYEFAGREYIIPVNYPEEANACHGFVYDKSFEVLNKTVGETEASCTLRYSYDKPVDGYPFSYTLFVTYTLLNSGGLICSTQIINQSNTEMPLSDGWHPYFEIGEKIDDLMLMLDVSAIIELNKNNIPTGKSYPYYLYKTPKLIGSDKLDCCFRVNGGRERISTRLISVKKDVSINVWQETGKGKYNYLMIYTPGSRTSIAIEPMTSNINSFNNQEELMMLSPKEEFSSAYGICIEGKNNGVINER